MIYGEPGSQSSLVLNGAHHCRISVTEQNRASPHIQIDVFIAIDIPQVAIHLAIAINRRNSKGVELGTASKEVGSTGNYLRRAIVE